MDNSPLVNPPNQPMDPLVKPHPGEVDGGITARTAALSALAGANEAVAGSAVFGAANLRRAIRRWGS